MIYFADLHVHSKFSRATSADCNLEQLALWAQRKGLAVAGTGDFTHPAWLAEIKEKLVPAEPGLFRLREDLEKKAAELVFPSCRNPTRFILQVEISTIYKKKDKTRKVHHVILVPDLEKADKIVQRLSRIGNITADGRPILGLDSRDLLEIILESGEGSYLIPAHIWTPWFSVFGSNSGFDSIEECYADLAPNIFALETGLSSDPAMNWRLSSLDRYRLVSNSDAHSPSKLGREACVFATPLDFFAMRQALETGDGYNGTIEFFPAEGKYHLDGHRKCGARLSPEETRKNSGLCPVCRKPVTVGVMNRVLELADRPAGTKPANAASFSSFVPLAEILSEVLQAGPASKTVVKAYQDLIARVGPELFILERAPLDEIRRAGAPVLAEAIQRMRAAQVICEAGYDGEYGVIRLFQPDELKKLAEHSHVFDFGEAGAKDVVCKDDSDFTVQSSRLENNLIKPSETTAFSEAGRTLATLRSQRRLPSLRSTSRVSRSLSDGSASAVAHPCFAGGPVFSETAPKASFAEASGAMADKEASRPATLGVFNRESRTLNSEPQNLDPEQQAAVEVTEGPLLIIAGPGAGKTRTLTQRIARLIVDGGVLPEQCLAITFTRRAAGEMQERLQEFIPDRAASIPVMTFHSLGLAMLKEQKQRSGLPEQFRVAGDEEREQLLMDSLGISRRKAGRLLAGISKCKRSQVAQGSAESLEVYEREMRQRSLVDFDDLIARPAKMLEANPDITANYHSRYRWISVDEYQDIDQQQYRLLKLLVPPGGNLCVIGDPDQAIYGFRGGDVAIFSRFKEDFPGARVIQLKRNYRSGKAIVQASLQAISPDSLVKDRTMLALSDDTTKIVIHESATDLAEAEFITHAIEQLIGGATFFSMDSGRVAADGAKSYSFADFAILCRTAAQTGPLREALARSGMPFRKCSHNCLADSPLALKIVEIMRQHFDLLDQTAASNPETHFIKCASGSALPKESLARSAGTDLALVQCLDKALLELEETEREEALMLGQALRPLAGRSADLENFLSQLALGVEADIWDPRADCISLLTLHASKGLEFPVVFMAGCEDGVLPLRWGDADDCDIAEERRLFFVGMTRAKERLFLCHAKRRRWMGVVKEMTPSPFLIAIEDQLLERSKTGLKKKKSSGADQLTLF